MRLAVLMSGGSGRRFWPLSRAACPKQLVPMFDGKSLLELAIERLLPVFGAEGIWIVTQDLQLEATSRVARAYGKLRVLSEPIGRSTAPCMAYASTLARVQFGDAEMAFLPADHLIRDQARFRRIVSSALDLVGRERLIATLGVKPDRPATGFGYIKRGSRLGREGNLSVFKVARFTEKPSLRVARRYLASGAYLWNAGIFLARASTLLEEIETWLPATGRRFREFARSVGERNEETEKARCYAAVRSISIDYAVMEKTARGCVVPAAIGWDDVGSWDSVARYLARDSAGNSVRGKHTGVDSRGCVVYAGDKFVATVGVEGIVVVATDDAILVASRSDAEKVKQLTDLMEKKGLTDLL